MKFKQLSYIIVNLFIGLLIFKLSTHRIDGETMIWLEAESAICFSSPFEKVEDINASGGVAVTTSMRSDEMESFLEYNIEVSQNAKYRFWANCFWPGGCNNSFLLQIDDGNRYVFGNDKREFNQWHWVHGPTIELNRGKHILKIWNKEAFSRLDVMMLSNNLSFSPQSKSKPLSLRIDFEQGLKNSLLKFKRKDNYKIIETKDTNTKTLVIKQGTYQPTEYFKIKYIPEKPFSYTINFDVSSDRKDNFNLKALLDIQGKSFIYCLIDNKNAYLIRRQQNRETILARSKLPNNRLSETCSLQIYRANNSITVLLNDMTLFKEAKLPIHKGYFAIGTNTGGILIHNVSISALD